MDIEEAYNASCANENALQVEVNGLEQENATLRAEVSRLAALAESRLQQAAGAEKQAEKLRRLISRVHNCVAAFVPIEQSDWVEWADVILTQDALDREAAERKEGQ